MGTSETKPGAPAEIPWHLRSPFSAQWIARAWWSEARLPATVFADEPEALRRRRWARALAALFDLARRERVAACRRLRIEGWEHLHVESPEGPGRIVTGSHLLGFDLGVLALGWFGHSLLLPPPGSGAASRQVAELQDQAGHRHAASEAWSESAGEHVDRGGWVALAADDALGDGNDGNPSALDEILRLAQKSRADIVPLSVQDPGDGGYRLVIAESIPTRDATAERLVAEVKSLAAAA